MAAKKQEKRPTPYVVLRSDDPAGPFSVVGNYTAQGQTAAKRAAVIELREKETPDDPELAFFIAVPASSFAPEKPKVKWVVTFEGVDGAESSEDDDEPEDETDDADAEPEADDGELPFEPLVPAPAATDADDAVDDDMPPPSGEPEE